MNEWLKSLLAAVGGGTVVLVGVFTIFKNLLIKLFESGMEASFEKSLEKYRSRLSRSSRAYEILLEREMHCYEKIGPLYAELVPLVQDLVYYAKRDDIDKNERFKAYAIKFKRYAELILELKNETLVYQAYIPQNIFSVSSKLMGQMQRDISFWTEVSNKLYNGDYNDIDYQKCQDEIDIVLLYIANVQVEIKNRLKKLSEL